MYFLQTKKHLQTPTMMLLMLMLVRIEEDLEINKQFF